jgi:hypothetical protein
VGDTVSETQYLFRSIITGISIQVMKMALGLSATRKLPTFGQLARNPRITHRGQKRCEWKAHAYDTAC